MCAKEIITVSTLISPLSIGKYKFEASYIPHFLLACLLPGVFQAACKVYMYMWKEIWMMTIAVTVIENSITSEPLAYCQAIQVGMNIIYLNIFQNMHIGNTALQKRIL